MCVITTIIKTKNIYNAKNIHYIHHNYRTVASILRDNSANKFCISLTIKTQKKMLIKRFIINFDNYILIFKLSKH